MAIDEAAFATNVLIDDRLPLNQLVLAAFQYQIATGRDAWSRALNSQANLPWITAGLDDKVIFKFALIAVEREVNPSIDLFVDYLSECRHLRVPPGGIVAHDV